MSILAGLWKRCFVHISNLQAMIPSERGCQLSSHIESSLHMLTAQQKSTTQVLRKGMNPNQPTNQPKDKHSAGNLQCPRNQPPKEFLLANKT